MLKSRRMRKALSMLCVLCMLFSVFANGAVAFADDETVADDVAIEQSSNMQAREDNIDGEDSSEIIQEPSDPTINEGNETDKTESITETLEPDEPVADTPSDDEDDYEPSDIMDEIADETIDETMAEADSVFYNSEPIKGDASLSGVTVKVLAPVNCFPDGTTVTINTVEAFENKVGFNITFIDVTGAKVQPAEGSGVTVSFLISASSSLLSKDGAYTKISVYHKNDDGTIEELKSIAAYNDPVEIEIIATHFSEYGVVSETIGTGDEVEDVVLENRENRSSTSTDLSDFLTDVIINAPQDENGNYIINPNSTYEMTLKFSENEAVQFDDEGVLIYNFPEGIIISDIGPTAFSLTVIDENGTAIVYDNIFEVVDGQLRIRFNQDDPNFERLKAMSNVNFSITISSSFDQTVGEIVFNEDIVKDFVYEETSDLTIQKSVVYDEESNTAYYELQISSEGLNENVIIEDWLTGTALIFNQDVVVESNINGTLDVTPDYSSVDNGFQVTIPQMVNGEVLTLRYSAAVDNTKISYNGSVEQTNNTARVTSDQVPDGKEASANFAGQVTFHRITKTAVGEPVEIGDGLYEQTWTILVNEDHKLPMGGTYIYDWILTNSRPFMQFAGDGITVNVTFEDGTTETRVVPWSDLFLYTDSNGTIGWRYLAPETDGNASYEITCTTLIDTSGALGDLTLVNGAQVYGSYEEGQVTIGQIGESHFDIQKEAVGTTSTESEWRITVTIPGSGLPEMHIVDDCPKLVYEGETYIDYPQEDSFEVEGLMEGESWNVSFSNDGRSFTVTFYTSETQNNANTGLLPTPDGQPRDIVVRYKTSVNQEWLELASNDGYASSTLYKHRNYTCAWSGSYRTPTVDASVVPILPDLVKDFIEQSEVEIDGVTYPVFRYSLTLLGPVEDGIVIQDSFPTEYLKLYEAAGIQIRGWSNSTSANGNGTVSAVDTQDGIEIIVSSFPKQNDGSFYSYYMISYSLIPKDQEALNALNAAAAASQNGTDLENTARWDVLESSSTANYTYFPYVDKELLTRPTAENGYVAEFQIIINKYAEDLDPTSDVLAIQDVLSANLRFIPDSLTISPANDSIIVQHDDETNTLTFTEVPDETTFVITYQARVLGSGNVTYSNTVKFGSFEMTVEEIAVVDSSGGGTGSNPSITIVKRDAEALSNTLSGATFQLFYMENGNRIPVQDSNGQNVTFTTGADGRVLIVGNLQNLGWTLWAGRTYCLIELTPPTGYELNEEPVYFILTEHPSSQIEFDITGDQLSVKDEPTKVSVPVMKNWVGPVGADAVIVHLFANGNDTGKTITLTADGNWTGSFENLRKYDDEGNEIQYSVEEDLVDNYAPRYDGSAEDGYTITNTSTETIDIPVVKQWVGPSAESVVVNLVADGEIIAEVVLNADNDWQHTFTDLPKYDSNDGHEIAYDVQEIPVEGYEQGRTGTVETGFTFTNTITGKVSVPVTKIWIGPAAESVIVELLADGVKVAEAVLNIDNGWQFTFTDFDKYNNGAEIIYVVRELRIDGYSTEIVGNVNDGFVITNTNTETIDIPVVKQWVGPAAESATINLLADGEVIAEVVLNAENDWRHTFTDLPKYDSVDGHEIAYTIEEISIDGYATEIIGDQSGYTITNINTETIDIPVVKQWVGPAAESATINLLADGEVIAEVVLNADNDWQHTFTDLPKYDSVDGHEIAYDVQEIPVEGYEQGRTGTVDTGFTFTNTITGKVSVPVTKIWIGPAAESVIVELVADGIKVAEAVLNAANGWQYTFADLDQYNNGVEIVYTIREVGIEGYATEITGDQSGYTITNINTETIDIPVVKQWVGPAAESATINLLADGEVIAEIVLNDENDWQHTFTGLPKYDSVDGHEIVYTIEEISIEGYATEITGDQSGYTITNINTETIDIPVVKQWVGPAAESVTINLLADGEIIAEVVLNAENDWQYTFTDLPKYNSVDGHEIAYDVQEIPVEGYEQGRTGTVDTGFTFTNTITGKVSIPVTKTWIGPATESVIVELLADGIKVAEAVLNAANGWQYTFADLDQYNNGVEIVYTIREVGIEGYATEITGDQSGYTITNINTETIDIPVVKQWVGPAAESATINLLADGEVIAEVVLNADNDWQHTFTDLPKYDSVDGHEIAYDVQEIPVEGYEQGRTGTVDTGFTFTNTITGKVSIPVTKTWIGPATESVIVELLADGIKVAEAVLNAANGWRHTFTDLPKYDSVDGHEIVYTIEEISIDGYATEITGDQSGYTITNTNTETIDIPVVKQWVGPAAESATINLLADGEVIAEVVLNAENDWRHTFTDLPKYDSVDGHEIIYTITEDALNGYTTSITGDMHSGFIVTNTKTTTPPHDTPQTGDNSHMLLYLVTLILSGAGLIWILLIAKRRSWRQKS